MLLTQFADPGMELLLIGNKCDLETRREVPKQEVEEFAQICDIPLMETSAKTGHNIDEVRGHFMVTL